MKQSQPFVHNHQFGFVCILALTLPFVSFKYKNIVNVKNLFCFCRTNYQKPTYVPRAQSVYNLYDDQTRTSDTHTLVKTSNLASTRAKSERCVAAALPCNQLNSGDHSPHLYSQNNQRNPLSVANELQQKQL